MQNLDFVYLLATRPALIVSGAFLTLLVAIPIFHLFAPPVAMVWRAGIESMF